MTDADELLREAQYALQNVSHGASDSKKHAAKAKSLARQIIRKYPNSPEVASAQSILMRLGEGAPPAAPTFDHVHTEPAEQHEHQFYPRSTDPESAERQFQEKINQYVLPGWPLRLAQAIPIVAGVLLVLEGVSSLSYYTYSTQNWFSLIAGTFLIYFPWTNSFNNLVDHAKTKMLVEEDWQANPDHLPTRQDIEELVSAAARGDKNKLIALVILLLVFGGLFMMFAAVLYVIGLRKVFDGVEGWLLNRKKPDAPNMKDNDHETPRDTP